MPPATIASAITSTRKTLRTDHSMRRPSMSVPLVAGGGGRSLLRGGGHGVFSVRISGLVTMTCMRVGGVLTVPGVWILSGARGRAVSCVTLQTLECRLQVAFGIDQEVGGDHDLLALGQAVEDLDPITAAPTQGDIARSEAAGTGLDQHHLARAAVEHGRTRNGQDRPGPRLLEQHGAVESRPEVAVGIGQGDAHVYGARHR